jgi:phosphopantothenoylcysteine decarboxylase
MLQLLMVVDGIAEARAAIGDQAKATFDDTHSGFTERLDSMRADDEEFLQNAKAEAKTINGSLEDELIQTSFNKNGKVGHEIVRMGDRVATTKKLINTEEAKLVDLWKQWDNIQDEYRELGIGIFGREAFGIEDPGREKGFYKEMALLDLEHGTRVKELEEEIESIGTDIMKKMKAAEKVWSATWRTISTDTYRNRNLLRRRTRRDFSNLFSSRFQPDHNIICTKSYKGTTAYMDECGTKL